MKRKIWLIGSGMGGTDMFTEEAKRAAQACDCLIGAPRLQPAGREKPFFPCVRNREIVKTVQDNPQFRSVGILVSGDPGFFSAARKLAEEFSGDEVEILSGVSSLSYFCAKLHMPWDDVAVLSLHGRGGRLIGSVMAHERVFVLTGGTYTAQWVCAELTRAGLGGAEVCVGENLSYENERITRGSADELKNKAFDSLSVLLVFSGAKRTAPGIPDDEFIRGNIPMTKFEVRSVSVAMLRIESTDIIYDIGAGTGSVSVEMAVRAPYGQVYAIEKNPDAIALISQNKKKFWAYQVETVAGNAPEAFGGLPAPDKVFIGGSAGNMKEIVAAVFEKNPQADIVVNAIALETLALAEACFREYGIQPEITQICASRARAVGSYNMMTAQNPVFILGGKGRAVER